jgi:hypothetical protein
MVIDNIVKTFIQKGGSIHPLIIKDEETKGTGLTNPSVFVDGDDILVNIRHVQYTLYNTNGKFESYWGSLGYFNPENDITLRTENYLCVLDNETFDISSYDRINTSLLNTPPMWEFIGLEDARLIKWDNNLYACGVRRDTKSNGEGRMELSKLEISSDNVLEISRQRIPAPGDDNSYCEKNWMPVLDMPYHFVKWTNPTEVVKVDPLNNTCETVHMGSNYYSKRDIRGSSQVITIDNYRVAITHEVDLWYTEQNHKKATYRHRVIVWDKEWNVVNVSEEFNFMSGLIEFCTGLAQYKNDILITFGYEDNAAYLLKVPISVFSNIFLPKKQKFNPHPEIYCISHINSKDRRDILLESFKNSIFSEPKILISTDEDYKLNKFTGNFTGYIDGRGLSITASHLKMIKYWYDNSNEKYALFIEDDVSLITTKYWNFTWEDFIDNLPVNWGCIQLMCIKENEFSNDDMLFRKRNRWGSVDWGATAYIMTREYAKKVIDDYCLGDNEFNLTIKKYNMIPTVENVIYDLETTYVIPLFVEDPNVISTVYTNDTNVKKEEYKNDHFTSTNFVLNWWKSKGFKYNINELINI